LQGACAAVGGTLAAQCACKTQAERCPCQNHKAKTLKPYWLKQKSNRKGAYYRNLLPIDTAEARDVMEIVAARQEESTIFPYKVVPVETHPMIVDRVLDDAIFQQIAHGTHRVFVEANKAGAN